MSGPPTGGWPQGPQPGSGQPGQGYSGPYPPPPTYGGPPAGPWPAQPGYPAPVPPPKGNWVKWLLGGLAVVLVIGLAVTTTLLLTRDDKGGNSGPSGSSAAPSDVASANDTGPVSIITVEPTCTAFFAINNAIASVQGNGWGEERDSLGPAVEWTPDQRTRVEAVATGLKRTTDQLVPLAKQTPHRVVRELYEQIIAYMREYVSSIRTYEARDNYVATAFVNAEVGMAALCNAIGYGSAPRAVVAAPAAPTSLAPAQDLADPRRFITASDATCEAWVPRETQLVADAEAWSRLDMNIAATNWSAEQRAANEAVFPVLSKYADEVEGAGRSSGNPILEDFAATAAIYLRAFVATGNNFVPEDGWLYLTGARLASVVTAACRAVGSN